MRNFAEILKEEREKMSLSQTDLGEKLNCSRYRVADLERGRITPTIEDINFLCDLFGISADYLLGRTEVRSIDFDLRTICDYTGLSEQAANMLNMDVPADPKERNTDYLLACNEFIESGAFFCFCSSVARKKTLVETFRKKYPESEMPPKFSEEYAKLYKDLDFSEYEAIKMCIRFIGRFSEKHGDISEFAEKWFGGLFNKGDSNG